MGDLREALTDALGDIDYQDELLSREERGAPFSMEDVQAVCALWVLRAYAAREDVVERCARAREAHYEKHGFGETPIDGFEVAAMQAALAAFLGEET